MNALFVEESTDTVHCLHLQVECNCLKTNFCIIVASKHFASFIRFKIV